MALLLGFLEIFLSSFFLYLNICLQIHPISAQPPPSNCNNNIGNYSENSNFQENLNTILSSVSSNVNTYGFYNGTKGDGVDQVNAIAFCRGDIDIELCRGCVKDAAHNLTVLCPNQKEAIMWFDYCEFRYSNKSIFSVMSIDPTLALYNVVKASDVTMFSGELHSFADILKNQAFNGSLSKYAGMKSNNPNAQTVYGYMQCTPDLTPGDCMSCLSSMEDYLSNCCYNQTGARAYSPSCTFRYEIYTFLNKLSNQPPPPLLSPSPSPPPPLLPSFAPPTTSEEKSSKSKTIIIVVCIIIALLVLTLSACVFITKQRRQNTREGQITNENCINFTAEEEEEEELEAFRDAETRQYDFSLIRDATINFSADNLLGKGGFGDVYKGVLSNGKMIAVKRLSTTSGQGENEFRNEVILLAKLQHKCLVKLLGFCLEKTERLLIYEFMANGSLDNILFDEVKRSRLNWRERYRIINSVAKGLLYLHEDSRLMIIHRDLKPSNILLDEEMNAKISDFGTARLVALDESDANTRRIAGTMGYMAPEYAMHGLFSVKSDVYSYGVLVLEIISGKRNNYSLTEDSVEGLLSYAYKTWREGRAFDLIDPMLTAHSHSLEVVMRYIHIALLCVQENVGSRPTMAIVNLMLQSLTMLLPLPTVPGFFGNSKSWLSEIIESSTSSSNQTKSKSFHANAQYDSQLNEEDTNSYLYPR